MDDFETLKFDPKYSVPKHPTRDGVGAYRGPEDDDLYEDDDEIKDKIAQARDALDESTLEWLDAKFGKHKMGLQEQLKLLKKHLPPNYTYDFDFETCPCGKHKEFLVCYKEDSEGSTVQEKRGSTCAKDFLDDLAMKHGISAGPDSQIN